MAKHRIAVVAGDGIGKEVMPEGLHVMDAAARKFGIDLQFDHFDFSSWDYYEKHGKMLPDNWKDQIGGHEAIYFGAVGWPEKIADHVSLWGSLLLFRREFDQYINLRPARLMPGVIAPVVRRKVSRYWLSSSQTPLRSGKSSCEAATAAMASAASRARAGSLARRASSSAEKPRWARSR